MKVLPVSLASLLLSFSAPSAADPAPAPAPPPLNQNVPTRDVRQLNPTLFNARLKCFFTPLANGMTGTTIQNASYTTYPAGSRLMLLQDDTTFVQFNLPDKLAPGQTYVVHSASRPRAKACVAAYRFVDLVPTIAP